MQFDDKAEDIMRSDGLRIFFEYLQILKSKQQDPETENRIGIQVRGRRDAFELWKMILLNFFIASIKMFKHLTGGRTGENLGI